MKQFDFEKAKQFKVAPYVGAWIETTEALGTPKALTVAPYVGAWIETNTSDYG